MKNFELFLEETSKSIFDVARTKALAHMQELKDGHSKMGGMATPDYEKMGRLIKSFKFRNYYTSYRENPHTHIDSAHVRVADPKKPKFFGTSVAAGQVHAVTNESMHITDNPVYMESHAHGPLHTFAHEFGHVMDYHDTQGALPTAYNHKARKASRYDAAWNQDREDNYKHKEMTDKAYNPQIHPSVDKDLARSKSMVFNDKVPVDVDFYKKLATKHGISWNEANKVSTESDKDMFAHNEDLRNLIRSDRPKEKKTAAVIHGFVFRDYSAYAQGIKHIHNRGLSDTMNAMTGHPDSHGHSEKYYYSSGYSGAEALSKAEKRKQGEGVAQAFAAHLGFEHPFHTKAMHRFFPNFMAAVGSRIDEHLASIKP